MIALAIPAVSGAVFFCGAFVLCSLHRSVWRFVVAADFRFFGARFARCREVDVCWRTAESMKLHCAFLLTELDDGRISFRPAW